MSESNLQQPLIIKKIKKGGHGHHGGAWKVAYADFVTAMMAFFLMLWLLSSATEEQREGIAEYFSPAAVSMSSSGSNGVMGGQSIITDGAMVTDIQPMGVSLPDPGAPELDRDDGEDMQSTPANEREGEFELTEEEQIEQAIAEREQREFEEAEKALREAIEDSELAGLAENLVIDMTPEGLRIQLVDQFGRSMFASGSAELTQPARELHRMVAEVIAKLPNNVSVRGHTDATPFRGRNDYTNWDLSADRANASRRALVGYGLPLERVANVVGKSDREPFDADNPRAPQNRRISIILLRDAVSPSDAAPERIEAGITADGRRRDADAFGAPEQRSGAPVRAVAPFRPVDP